MYAFEGEKRLFQCPDQGFVIECIHCLSLDVSTALRIVFDTCRVLSGLCFAQAALHLENTDKCTFLAMINSRSLT